MSALDGMTSCMAQSLSEKPHHYSYLKEFRTQQCPLFLQHKCTQHRPFACFNWHFMNQRRRRPVRKRDGTFNYNPDNYCGKYDETAGMCPDGDECVYLHRTAGDTERRYHLRYYKTGTCVHETDSKGHCTKNGPHCAFAHGAHDLRPAVYDVRELQSLDLPEMVDGSSVVSSSLEKERVLLDDPNWNDPGFVLRCYKTEPCKRPPRLCRQGYACPQFHNFRDRRRSPQIHKYRSTPCPHVKHGDDWGDPGQCEASDDCSYCHTRTEQQFHPEIYKSTKCNDMAQSAYCPRGPFCAFAHVDHEMTSHRELHMNVDTSLAAFVSNALPSVRTDIENGAACMVSADRLGSSSVSDQQISSQAGPRAVTSQWPNAMSNSPANTSSRMGLHSPVLIPYPVGNERRSTPCSNLSDSGVCVQYSSVPGLEDDTKYMLLSTSKESDHSVDVNDHSRRLQNAHLFHNANTTPPLGGTPSNASQMSPLAPSFHPACDTVGSVVGNALDDLTIDDFDLSSIDKEIEKDTDSIGSPYSAGFQSQTYLGATSVPVNIPNRTNSYHGNLGRTSHSPSSPITYQVKFNSVPQQLRQQQKQEQQIEQAAAAFNSQPNPGKFAARASGDVICNQATRRQAGVIKTSCANSFCVEMAAEIQRLRTELMSNKKKLSSWEESMNQARNACDAWKREAEEAFRKAKACEEQRIRSLQLRDEAMQQYNVSTNPCQRPHVHDDSEVLKMFPLSHVMAVKRRLQADLQRLDKVMDALPGSKCLVCRERPRTLVVVPCNHFVLCSVCQLSTSDCPVCNTCIQQCIREETP